MNAWKSNFSSYISLIRKQVRLGGEVKGESENTTNKTVLKNVRMKQTNEMYWPSWRTSEVKWLSSVETTWNTLTLIVKSVFPSHAGGWLKCHIDNLASFEQEINISLVAKRIFFYKETHIFVIPSWKKKKRSHLLYQHSLEFSCYDRIITSVITVIILKRLDAYVISC